jgi:hypothetical protein
MPPEAELCEPNAEEIEQVNMANAMRELIAFLERPRKEVSQLTAAAKITALAAMAEAAGDVSSLVWNQVGPEMRKAAFILVLGITAQSLE